MYFYNSVLTWRCYFTLFLLAGMLLACAGDDGHSHDHSYGHTNMSGIDLAYFTEGALLEEPSIVDCTLTDGTKTMCHRLVVTGVPSNHDMGPFCPETIYDDGSNSGVWFDGIHDDVYSLTGDFIVNLPIFYDDAQGDDWILYDSDTGDIYVTYTEEGCHLAAVPNVALKYYNYCVQCEMSYTHNPLNELGGLSAELLIPVTPVVLGEPYVIDDEDHFVGVSLNGVFLSAPAPMEDILKAYNIAAFDECGAHINPNEGYHYHGATDCMHAIAQSDGHADLIGYMLDGYALYANLNSEGEAATDLDECNGHSDPVRGYHYHASEIQNNQFIGCFHGAQGSGSFSE